MNLRSVCTGKRASRVVLGALTILALGVAPAATAKTVVIAPLGGADPKATSNVSSMMSSELSFMAGIDDVVELKAASVNGNCLASASCLSGLLKSGPGDQLVAGTLVQNGTKYTLDLVLFDGPTNKMVRRKKFDLPATPEGVADGMNGVVKELLTGAASGVVPGAPPPAKPATASREEEFAFEEDKPVAKSSPKPGKAPPPTKPLPKADDEDNFDIDLSGVDIDEEADEHAALAAKAEADAKAKADADARAKADADAKARAAAEAKRRADEDARRQAEAEAARKKAAEEARLAAQREAQRKAEEEEARRQAAAEAARQKAADDARRAEEARVAARKAEADAAARKAADDARRQAAAAPPEDDFDPNAISFGKSKVEDDEVNKAISFAPTRGAVSSFDDPEPEAPKPAPKVVDLDDEEDEELMPAKKKPAFDDDEDEAPRRRVAASDEDDDAPARKVRSSDLDDTRSDDDDLMASRPKPKAKADDDDEDDVRVRKTTTKRDEPKVSRVQLAVRGGYSRFYDLNFITAGGELAIGVAPTVYLVGGIDSFSVQRQIPRFLQQDGRTQEWNTIFPGSFGVQYKAEGNIRPYVGADGMVVPYYFDANGKGSMALGARARFGVDFMVVDNFGFNLNGSVGFWTGENWKLIQVGMGSFGVVPQISAGTLVAF